MAEMMETSTDIMETNAAVTLEVEVCSTDPLHFLKGKSDVKELSNEEIHKWMSLCSGDLRDIIEGKCDSWRHDAFKRGAKSRGKLKYQMRSHRFTLEQSEIVAGRITKLLCQKDMKLFGSGMDVLWPEALLMLLMDFYYIHLQEAEKMMMSFDHEGDTDDEL